MELVSQCTLQININGAKSIRLCTKSVLIHDKPRSESLVKLASCLLRRVLTESIF